MSHSILGVCAIFHEEAEFVYHRIWCGLQKKVTTLQSQEFERIYNIFVAGSTSGLV